jgi:hypothetical protein
VSLALRCRQFVVPAIVALAASGFITKSASAGVLVESAADCSSQSLSQPFMPWADPAQYTLSPGGSFESGAPGWALSGASVGSGNEPYYANEDDGSHSLSIASGGSALSAPICVGLEHPTVRFFAKRSGGGMMGGLSTVAVSVVYENALGLLEELPIGLVAATSSWQPTAPMAVVANLLPLLPGERTAVAFRFSAIGTASWSIDDVFVDPWRGS